MKSLIELTGFASRNKVRHIDVMGNEHPGKKPTKINILHDAIRDGRVKTDEDAAELLGMEVKSTTFRNVKNGLKRRLLNTIFFIDVKQAVYNEQQAAYFNCWREWAAVKILVAKGAHFSAMELCQKIIGISIQYEFVDLILDVTKQMRLYYGTIEGDRKKFDHYNNMYLFYEQALIAENKVEEYFCDLTVDTIRQKAAQQDVYSKAILLFPELDTYLAKFPFFRLQFLGRMIKIAAYMAMNDYHKTLAICEEGLSFFEQKKFEVKIPLSVFLHQKLVCHLQLKQFEAGKAAAERSLGMIPDGAFNWFKNHELHFLLAMHTREYKDAYLTWSNATTHKKYQYLDDSSKEKWTLYGFFLHYLTLLGKLETPKEETKFNNFRLGKFLNQVPTYTQDKRGLNIPILIAQILFLVLKKEYDLVINRMETIEKYCARYLRQDDSFRSNCFIRMLLQLPEAGFHRAAAIRKAQKFLDKLSAMPLEIAAQPFEIEIIPYEDLWQFVLDSLGNKHFGAKPQRHLQE